MNTKIPEQFVPEAQPFSWSKDTLQRQQQQANCLDALRQKVFAGWPAECPSTNAEQCFLPMESNGVRCQVRALNTQPGLNLSLYLIQDAKTSRPETILLTILDSESWSQFPRAQPLAQRRNRRTARNSCGRTCRTGKPHWPSLPRAG